MERKCWRPICFSPQFYGASNTTPTGVEPELNYAATVFAGTTTVSIPPGCKAYWSPTNAQFSNLQTFASSQSNSISDTMWSSSSVGAPKLWIGQPKQAVIKSSIANNKRACCSSAPAIVLFQLAPSGTSPAVITVP